MALGTIMRGYARQWVGLLAGLYKSPTGECIRGLGPLAAKSACADSPSPDLPNIHTGCQRLANGGREST